MMSSEAGYTAALMKASLALGKVAPVSDDLPVILELINSSAGFFKSPKVAARDKADAITQLLGGKADDLTVTFTALLAQRGRLRYLPGICKRFKRLADAELGRARIKITLPYQPSDEILEKLKVHLADIGLCQSPSDVNVSFEVSIDKSIIGGFVAESDSKLVDMSLKTRLVHLGQTTIR